MKILLANITTMVGVIGGVEKVFSNMANERCYWWGRKSL